MMGIVFLLQVGNIVGVMISLILLSMNGSIPIEFRYFALGWLMLSSLVSAACISILREGAD